MYINNVQNIMNKRVFFIIDSHFVLIELYFYQAKNNKHRFGKHCTNISSIKAQHMTEIMTRVTGDMQRQLPLFHVMVYYEKRII